MDGLELFLNACRKFNWREWLSDQLRFIAYALLFGFIYLAFSNIPRALNWWGDFALGH